MDKKKDNRNKVGPQQIRKCLKKISVYEDIEEMIFKNFPKIKNAISDVKIKQSKGKHDFVDLVVAYRNYISHQKDKVAFNFNDEDMKILRQIWRMHQMIIERSLLKTIS